MVITSLQLLQMVVGCVVNYTAYTFKTKGQLGVKVKSPWSWITYYLYLMAGMSCGVSETNLRLSLLMYSSYFILFARFFYSAYFAQSQSQRKLCPEEKEFRGNPEIFSPALLQTKQDNQDDSRGGQLKEGSDLDRVKTEEEKD